MNDCSSMRSGTPRRRFGWIVGVLAAWMLPFFLADHALGQGPIKILFLGDQGHHRPADLYRVLEPALKNYGIEVTYTEDIANALTARKLNEFDGLLIYANIDELGKEQEAALLEYVRSGKGLIPLHCATYCFRNSNPYIELVGAQFKEHGGQRFSTHILEPNHPIMKGFEGFESWDETYVHHKHNTKDRIVLEERRQGQLARDTTAEPWTWVRTHGDGRVFYTAWGHNMDTWGHQGFQNLVARGIHWACKKDPSKLPAFSDPTHFDAPKITELRKDVAPFAFVDVGNEIPNYTPGEKWGSQGAPKSLMQIPLTASESQKHYVLPEGFDAKLWAIEKDVQEGETTRSYAGLEGKPIAMTWDHRGRLWVCETVDYPNELQPQGKGRDRIRICEDTDGDGKADKFTVFASHMSIPTAIACYRDGVIVQDGVKTVYLKDIDGDDVADMRQELITGWAMGDTHGGVSNFQYGLDNWIWGMQGYNDSHPVINGKQQQGFRQGFFRFALISEPSDDDAPVYPIGQDGLASTIRSTKFDVHSVRVSKLEFVRSTNNNTWGFGLSEDGLIFGSTANSNPSIFMPVANAYYERVSGWSTKELSNIADTYKFKAITENIRQVDQHGGYTAAAGHALYTARNYPKQWWNRLAFVCEPTGHLIGSFVLQRDGAGYKSTSPFNLIASDDEWASPIMAEVGPDGNIWFLDWYNFIIQHNPTPHGFQTGKGNAYETKLRDKRFGRVYRLVYDGPDGLSVEELKKTDQVTMAGLQVNDEASLVEALKHSNMLWRRTAQRLLVEKPTLTPKTLDGLRALTQDKSVDGIGLNVGAIHAIWVLAARNAWTTELAFSAMSHPSLGVQRNAVAAAPNTAETAKAVVANKLLTSNDAQVRLAAILKLADVPAGSAGVAEALLNAGIVSVIPGTSDRWLLDAWTSAASMHAETLLPKLVRDTELEVTPELAARISIVAEHAARNRLNAETVAQLVVPKGNPAVTTSVIAGLNKGWPRDYRISLPEATSNAFVTHWLKGDLPLEAKGQVIQLAGALGVQKLEDAVAAIREELLKRLKQGDLTSDQRLAAAKQMVLLEPSSEAVVAALLAQVSPQSAPDFSSGLVSALSGSKLKGLAGLLIERSQSMPPEFLRNSIRMMLSRPETTRDLIDAIEAGKLTINDLQLDQRQLLRDHPDAKIREKATAMMKSSGGIPNADRQKLVETWMPLTESSGDAAQGKLVYQKHCALCHRHGDLGNAIGPELTGMAVHPKAELLVNILDPNRSVEGNFRTYNVQTTDGEIVTGMMAGESKTAIEIVNVQGKREVVLREDIERITGSQKSLMPEGFESQMTRDDMKDLLEFLTNKGKYVPLSIASVATSITTKGMFFDSDGQAERLVFPDWKPKIFKDIPFVLIDPQGDRIPNAVMLYGPNGKVAPNMPKSVDVVCNSPAVAIHFLSGVGGWSFPASRRGSTSMIVRITYADDTEEDHEMINGEHFADYITRVDVPQSDFAFDLSGRQIRYFAVKPRESKALKKISLIKGKDSTAPVVMAMTLQTTP